MVPQRMCRLVSRKLKTWPTHRIGIAGVPSQGKISPKWRPKSLDGMWTTSWDLRESEIDKTLQHSNTLSPKSWTHETLVYASMPFFDNKLELKEAKIRTSWYQKLQEHHRGDYIQDLQLDVNLREIRGTDRLCDEDLGGKSVSPTVLPTADKRNIGQNPER